MGLIYSDIKLQEDLTANAATFTNEISVGYVLQNLIVKSYALKNSGSAATVQNLVDKIDQFRISTVNSDPESTIDADDLHDFTKYAFGTVRPFVSKLTSTDNIRHAVTFLYPFTTFPNNYRAPYGLAPNLGTQITYTTTADGTQTFDNYTTDMITEGVTSDVTATNGHIKFTRTAHTFGAVDETKSTPIQGKKLLGVYNFMTTSYDDLAASAAINVTGIREQKYTENDSVVLKWKPDNSWGRRKQNTLKDFAAIAGDATDNTDILDDGRWFQDLGIQNIPAGINLNANSEIKTVSGVAEATRIYPVLLV